MISKKLFGKLNRKARFFLSLQVCFFYCTFSYVPIASIGMSPGLAEKLIYSSFYYRRVNEIPGEVASICC